MDSSLPKNFYELPFEQRIYRLAYDLANGARQDEWAPAINVHRLNGGGESWECSGHQNYTKQLKDYLHSNWGKKLEHPQASFLEVYGYFQRISQHNNETEYLLTEKAMKLLNPAKIFISYRRIVSSPIAMLIWSHLRGLGFNPFIDIRDIETGDIWEEVLKKKIEESNVFIIVIGQDIVPDKSLGYQKIVTTDSIPVANELKWALETVDEEERFIIPILHNGITENELVFEPFTYIKSYKAITLAHDTSDYLSKAIEELDYILQKYL